MRPLIWPLAWIWLYLHTSVALSDWPLRQIQIPLFRSIASQKESSPSTSQDNEFSLRHVFHHGIHQHPEIHIRAGASPNEPEWIESTSQINTLSRQPLYAGAAPVLIERLQDRSIPNMLSMYSDARRTGQPRITDASAWQLEEVSGPNITDKQTVVNLAKMSWNAYTEDPGDGEWQYMNGTRFNHSMGFGWEADGLRGHIFATRDNKTIVMSLKGTSPAVFDGAETTTNDKLNDNLFFSCCCGQGGQFLWHQVCDCKTSAYTCNSTCLVKALKEENRYYAASIELFGNVTELYPNSNVWLVGHSLGGSTSALLGLTFGLPVTTFEAPGEALAAARLGLPTPPDAVPGAPQTRKYTGAYHFGHTADPIFMGTCNAATSACTLGGYAMQTQCHTGQICVYDTVQDMQWRVGAGYHRIRHVVENVLEVYDEVAPCFSDAECIDCFNWKYFESNHSDTTTSTSTSTSTPAPTRTTTCKTPGWWGCLDETTSTSSTSSSEITVPTTSCLSYGWFGGCLETTTLCPTKHASSCPTSSLTAPTAIFTTSCASHGFLGLGCYSTTTLKLSPTTCVERGWFGFCKSTATLYPTATPAAQPVPTITTTRPLSTTVRAR